MRQIITLVALIAVTFLWENCHAGEFRYLQVDKLHLESARYFGSNRHWSARVHEPRVGTLKLKLDLSGLNKTLFIRQKVESHYTTSQFRYLALTEEIAIEPWKKGIEVFVQHKSEHALDYTYQIDYPNSNTIGVRIKFID